MKQSVMKRAVYEANLICTKGYTVREVAKQTGIAKSTAHLDVTERLSQIDKELYLKVQDVLQKHLSERHLKGGEATKKHWLDIKNSIGR